MKNNIQVSIEIISTEQVNNRAYFKIKYMVGSQITLTTSAKKMFRSVCAFVLEKYYAWLVMKQTCIPTSILLYDAQLRVLDICWVKTHTYGIECEHI